MIILGQDLISSSYYTCIWCLKGSNVITMNITNIINAYPRGTMCTCETIYKCLKANIFLIERHKTVYTI